MYSLQVSVVRKLPGFNDCGRCIFIPFSPGMQPAWPGEPEELPQPPPPANAIIGLYYSQIVSHQRAVNIIISHNNTFNTSHTK
jgi:hypothetical protein